MELFGIKFAPLNVPLERRLQTLAASCWFVILAFGNVYCTIITLYLLLFTRLRWLMVAYLMWIWIDRNTCNRGSRRSHWVRNWKWWHYFRDFFPLRLVKTVDLDPNRNYLFAVYPHGVLSSGAYGSFATDVTGFHANFPGITPYILTLHPHFMTPFLRELPLALGSCSASSESIDYLLGSPGTGRAACLIVGGASEALESKPGTYRIILKRRKGFIRLAIKHGAPLVPVFSFGETDIFDQMDNPEGSWLRWLQKRCQKITGVAPVVPIGRGWFQYSFGLCPRRSPVTTVVGKPLEVKKNPEPTKEEIDAVHQEFTKCLVALFEDNKHKYLKNAENISLEIF
ncbi:2-acylglycerol O-acyltransferase 2-A isoform X2 [Anabrus simplex]